MIVPMKKISLVTLKDKRDQTLEKLRSMGLVQIEITEGSGQRLIEIKNTISLLENGIFAVSELSKAGTKQINKTKAEAIDAAKRISALQDIKKSNEAEILSYRSELERIGEWGAVSPDDFLDLSAKGYELALYNMPVDVYKKLDEGARIIVLDKSKTSVKFVTVNADGSLDDFKGYQVNLPKISTDEIQKNIAELEERSKKADSELYSYLSCCESMKRAACELKKELEFETYSSGMETELLSENSKNDVSVAYFNGFIDAQDIDKLKSAAKENSWGLIIDDPTVEDDAPTKLKNNKLVSLIYPLTDFLGTVPGYFEYDISSWFLGFILIFFGIIFGDGGYGLIIGAVSGALILKSYSAKKQIPQAFVLIGLFGLATILWGTLTCTWFGISPDRLPTFLRAVSVPFISNVYADRIWYPFWTNGKEGLTTSQNLQILCFSLALIQLTVAHIKGMVRNRKSLKALGDLGSVLQLWGIFYIVLALVVNGKVFEFNLVISNIPVGSISLTLIAVGFVMSFIFANYEGSIVKSILSSVTNIVSVLLGVVNVFSDIVSYIRLWAVGLAGAAISTTINELAGPLFGKFAFMIFAIIILVFGHGLNMILNVLSVIVHGIRLNTLEFSSHLDMSWSGHKFKPFEE